jgi:hypothetical protein
VDARSKQNERSSSRSTLHAEPGLSSVEIKIDATSMQPHNTESMLHTSQQDLVLHTGTLDLPLTSGGDSSWDLNSASTAAMAWITSIGYAVAAVAAEVLDDYGGDAPAYGGGRWDGWGATKCRGCTDAAHHSPHSAARLCTH